MGAPLFVIPPSLRLLPLTEHTGRSLTRRLSLRDFSHHQSTAAGESDRAARGRERLRVQERENENDGGKETKGEMDLIKKWRKRE